MNTETKDKRVAEKNHPNGSAVAPDGRLLGEVRDLHGIVTDALDFRPPRHFRSIFGPARSWLPPWRPTSEYRVLGLWESAIAYLFKVGVPSFLRRGRDLEGHKLFVNPTKILREADPQGRYDSFPSEAWFYINGLATHEPVARLNARCLANLTYRPIIVIHNATDSVVVDLLESAIGKSWEVMSRPARRAYQVILESLEDPAKERVIVIAHSQGTIITANVLRALYNPDFKARLFQCAANGDAPPEALPGNPRPDQLAKLEVYAFANCATVMRHHPEMASKGVPVPFIESFGNELDLVARLGMLAPRKERHGITIEGSCYVETGKWGHLLNAHYLFEISDVLEAGRPEDAYQPIEGAPRLPRFYGYFRGQSPDPY